MVDFQDSAKPIKSPWTSRSGCLRIGTTGMKAKHAKCPWTGKPDPWRRWWEVSVAGQNLYAVLSQDVRPCEEPLDPAEAHSLLESWFAMRGDRKALREMYEAAGGATSRHLAFGGQAAAEEALRHGLRQAFDRGRLVLLSMPFREGVGGPLVEALLARQAAGPPEKARPEPRKKTWVELRLVDMEGNPVGGKHYLVKTPDGGVQEGFLDKSGRARLDNIDPGNCMFSFPDLDREAWERAASQQTD
jgi:hypothetical protein